MTNKTVIALGAAAVSTALLAVVVSMSGTPSAKPIHDPHKTYDHPVYKQVPAHSPDKVGPKRGA